MDRQRWVLVVGYEGATARVPFESKEAAIEGLRSIQMALGTPNVPKGVTLTVNVSDSAMVGVRGFLFAYVEQDDSK